MDTGCHILVFKISKVSVFMRVDQTNTYLPISTEKFECGLCSFHLMKK